MRQIRNTHKTLVGKNEGKRLIEDLDVDGTIIIELILETRGGNLWIRFIWLRIG